MDRIRDNKTKPWYRDPRTPVYVILPNCIPKKKRKNHESRTNWCRKSETEDGRIGPSNFASQLEDSVVEPKIEHVGKEPSESPGRGEGIMTLFFFRGVSQSVRHSGYLNAMYRLSDVPQEKKSRPAHHAMKARFRDARVIDQGR
jgi:hypothetical protein